MTGPDVLSRLLYAGSHDLSVGALPSDLPVLFGTALGTVARYYAGGPTSS